ncbi:hypothetical protein QR105_25345, partial [Salmonella enterica]|nr:hypothetical protein [Salmonella enterica]
PSAIHAAPAPPARSIPGYGCHGLSIRSSAELSDAWRGIEGSRATHQTVQHYYESINRGTRSQVSISPEALEP